MKFRHPTMPPSNALLRSRNKRAEVYLRNFRRAIELLQENLKSRRESLTEWEPGYKFPRTFVVSTKRRCFAENSFQANSWQELPPTNEG